MQLRHRAVKKAGEANGALGRPTCRKWPAIGVLLAGMAGVPGSGAQAQEQPTGKTRTVMVCRSKDTPIESCKPYVCEEGQRCVPADKEKIKKPPRKFGMVMGAAIALIFLTAFIAHHVSLRKQTAEPSKQGSKNTDV